MNLFLQDLTSINNTRLPVQIMNMLEPFTRNKLRAFCSQQAASDQISFHNILARVVSEVSPIKHPLVTNSFFVNTINSVLDEEAYRRMFDTLNPDATQSAMLEEAAWTRVLQVCSIVFLRSHLNMSKYIFCAYLSQLYCDPEFENVSSRVNHAGLLSLKSYPLHIIARVHRELHCNQWICSSYNSSRARFVNRVYNVS